MKVFYSPLYVGSAYAFETTRKAAWVAESLAAAPIPGVVLAEPRSLTRADLEQVHDAKYVRAVETGEPRYLAESQGFDWDSGLWPMVLSSNGGAVAAALEALESGTAGSLSSGLHHARRASGAGFCTFNGLVLAARAALAAGAESVLVLDLDAHCGGGTASLVADEPRVWQTDVAVDMFDFYGSLGGPDEARRINFRVTGDAADYLADIELALAETARALAEPGRESRVSAAPGGTDVGRAPQERARAAGARPGGAQPQSAQFDLCFYNAGMDPHEDCSTGGLRGITRDMLARREQLVFSWCREHARATAFVLAGGYISRSLDEAALVALHRLTLEAAARATSPPSPRKGPVAP